MCCVCLPNRKLIKFMDTIVRKPISNIYIQVISFHFFSPLDPNRILVSGQSLAATAVGKQSCFTLSNVVGAMEDIEIMIDAPSGDAVLADITDTGNGAFRVDFTPQIAGEHQVCKHVVGFIGFTIS